MRCEVFILRSALERGRRDVTRSSGIITFEDMQRWLPRAARTACVFCEKDAFTVRNHVLFEDELVVAIADKNPRARAHLLVISKTHIPSVDDLTTEHTFLLSRMIATGRDLLARDGFIHPSQYQLGFHKPPFTSVPHLHLHCLGLPFLPAWNQLRFMPTSLLDSYVDADTVVAALRERD